MTPYQYRMLKEKLSGLFKVWHYTKGFVKDICLVIMTMFYVGLILYVPIVISIFLK